jgi:flavin-dependent dehydrogenase
MLVDAVILGGGPAGAAAARLLAARGHAVVVLARIPARPALAESLPPSVGKLLDRIGVRGAIDAAGFVRATGNTVWWGTRDPRVERFGGEGAGWQITRDVFDRVMLDQAAAAGARVIRRAVVRGVRLGEGGGSAHAVDYQVGARPASISCRWVLDCTGRAGLVARQGWRRPDPAGRTLALVGVWDRPGGWSMLPDVTHTLVESYDGGWAWSVPASASRRYVTVMVDPALTSVRTQDGSAGLTTIYKGELARATRLAELTRSGRVRLTRPAFARDASSYSAGRFGDDGVLLVGDAGSFVDPLSSFGIKKALSSAWLASVAVHTAISEETMGRHALDLFEQRERAMSDGLRRRFADLSRVAVGTPVTEAEFWRTRAEVEVADDGEPDVAALRQDPDVVAAFNDMRRRSSVVLRPSPVLRRVERPTVRADRVALEEHLVVPAFRDGVRYLRSIDLVTIVALAADHDQVPDLYDAYTRTAGPAALPDFLGALSVLVGKRMLDLA